MICTVAIVLKSVNKGHYAFLLQFQNSYFFENSIMFIVIFKGVLAIIVMNAN